MQSPSNGTTTGRQLTAVLNYVSGRLLLVLTACSPVLLATTTLGHTNVPHSACHASCSASGPTQFSTPSCVPLLPLLQLLFDDSIWNLLPTVGNEVRLRVPSFTAICFWLAWCLV